MTSRRHIYHLEELVLYDQDLLVKALELLADPDQNRIDSALSVKIDGSPAFVFGIDHDGFFVSTKSYFNKGGSVRFRSTHAIMDAGFVDSRLQMKMCHLFTNLREAVRREGIECEKFHLMGDFLFGPGEVKGLNFFRPNVIRYPLNDTKILDEAIGICIHTRVPLEPDEPLRSTDILLNDSLIYQMHTAHMVTLPEKYWTGSLCDSVRDSALPDRLLADTYSKWANYNLRQKYGIDFNKYCDNIYDERKSALKTETARERCHQEKWKIKSDPSLSSIDYLFERVTEFKNRVVDDLDSCLPKNIYIDKRNGFFSESWQIASEGYVLDTGHGLVKLVSRNVFSRYNFDPDTVRGFAL